MTNAFTKKIIVATLAVLTLTRVASADSFSMTPNAGIPGYNQETHEGISALACQDLCIGRSWCKSADYERAKGKCFLQPVNKFEQSLKTDYPGNPFDHYHKSGNVAAAPQPVAAPQRGAQPGTQLANQLLRSPGKQCVKAKFGILYAAKVRWYDPLSVIYNPDNGEIAIKNGARAYKTEDVAVLQTSCVQTNKKMVAQVSVIGGEIANQAITIAAGTTVAIAGAVTGAVVCVGTVGAGCPAAVGGVSAAVGGAVSLAGMALPDAKTTFYVGAPGKLELSGTVWSPEVEEVRAFGKGLPIGRECSSDGQCANNTCARDSAREGNRSICCPSGREGFYTGYEYCHGLTSGQVCWTDAMCSSGICEGNMYGAQRGECK